LVSKTQAASIRYGVDLDEFLANKIKEFGSFLPVIITGSRSSIPARRLSVIFK
jgi:hypothetical protein